MKKKLKSMKGFAMAELLAVSMVVLLIFSILFSNYLPLVAEYENRLNYNNTSAQFAAYYARKIYNGVMENDEFTTIGSTINSNKYYIAYNSKKDNFNICNSDVSKLDYGDIDEIFGVRKETNAIPRCQSIFNEYGVEEIILTKYKLTDVKNGYTQNDGTLYNYIKYLPEYKNTVYQDNNDLYRIIIKTKDGYATTPIVADYYTPGSCFTTTKGDDGGLTVTGYKQDNGDCGANVVFTNKQIKTNGGGLGVITAIANGAFKGKEITSISLENGKVKTIGDEAFKNSKLSGDLNLSNVSTIGKEAFFGTFVAKIAVDASKVGNGAFSNIKTLTDFANINSTYNVYNVDNLLEGSGDEEGIKFNGANISNVGNSTFKNTKLSSVDSSKIIKIGNNAFEGAKFVGGIKLNLSAVTSIGNNAFKNVDLNGITLGSTLTSIGSSAFEISDTNTNTTLASLSIPSSVNSMGDSVFKNRKITNLTFGSSSALTSISNSAFSGCNITSGIDIPSSVTSIGNSAFSNNSLSSVKLGSKLISIGQSAFENNNSFASVSIPSAVNSIGSNVFKGCDKIDSVEVQSNLYKDSEQKWCDVFGYNSGCEVKNESTDTSTWYLNAGDRNISILYKGGDTNE